MSKNPTFDDVIAHVFKTLDVVYQLHAPENPEDEDGSNCLQCDVEFPCATQEVILGGLADISLVMEAAAKTSSNLPAESEQPSS